MKKVAIFALCAVALCACDKHDPILPGERQGIFATDNVRVLNTPVPDAPENIAERESVDCPYTQDNQNTIWNGDKKIFAGFPTNNYVIGQKSPVCNDGFVFAGLSTGELVKVNPKNRQIAWIADVYRQKWKVKSEREDAQSYPTLSNPMDGSLPGSSIHGIFLARVLEWGATAFSTPHSGQ